MTRGKQRGYDFGGLHGNSVNFFFFRGAIVHFCLFRFPRRCTSIAPSGQVKLSRSIYVVNKPNLSLSLSMTTCRVFSSDGFSSKLWYSFILHRSSKRRAVLSWFETYAYGITLVKHFRNPSFSGLHALGCYCSVGRAILEYKSRGHQPHDSSPP